MQIVTDYWKFGADCRRLAAQSAKPDDSQDLELMAVPWERLAKERARELEKAVAEKNLPWVSYAILISFLACLLITVVRAFF
jgi:hypothetical protein